MSKSVKELSIETQKDFTVSLEKENAELKRELEHLKARIVMQQLGHDRFPSQEEMICIEQISILKSRSLQRELSLEEVKKLDLLVKNLRLVQEKSTENLNQASPRDVSEDFLVAIASQSES